MRSSSRKPESQDLSSVAGSSAGEPHSVHSHPVPVWVTHTPTPASVTNDGDNHSAGGTSSSGKDNEHGKQKESVGRRSKSLFPKFWGSALHKWMRQRDTSNEPETKTIEILPNGTRVSPPVSPLMSRSDWSQSSSHNSQKPLLMDRHDEEVFNQFLPPDDSMLSSIHPAEYYAEKLEVYNLKYSYLKSWPGLLRLLAGLQLVFGGMVVACVIAYIQKDSEWSNSYGMYNGVFNNGQGPSGYSYGGPMTPFVLVVAGLCWILTLILLVVGMTMYYRTILLDSPWWPLTEAFINVAMFLLHMAAGIVYINDLNRGGLCFMSIGNNPLVASLCRVEGGQMAGTAFMFINMVMYLGSFLVCLKMWRHEAARRERKYFEDQPIPLNPPKRKRISFRDETDRPVNEDWQFAGRPEVHGDVMRLNGGSEYTPKVTIIADYVIKYPEISCVEEREKYRAVFNDQYQEYKDLHRDVSSTLSKFTELDAAMDRLLGEGKSQQDRQRIQSILRTYEEKKRDPAFLEKRERCEYLKAKLSHIKNRIRTFDQETAPSRLT